jgi:hypothetical protein
MISPTYPLTRLHALTKADNLGLGLVVIGLLPQTGGLYAAKLIGVWLLVLVASSAVSQLIGRAAKFLPLVPEGDIVVAGEKAAQATVAWSAPLESADAYLRRWPVACLSLLVVAIILGALMLAGR